MPRHDVPLAMIEQILYPPVHSGHLVLPGELTKIVEQLHHHPVETIMELAGDLHKSYHTTQKQVQRLLYYTYRERYGTLTPTAGGRS